MKTETISVVSRLEAIEKLRRPLLKIVLSRIEGKLGHWLVRKLPPRKATKQLLNLGCADQRFSDWVNADYYRFSDLLRRRRALPDWLLDAGKTWRCHANYWDRIHTEHTLEHLNYHEAINVLKESLRTLKSGGYLRIVLPGLEESLADRNCVYQAEAVAYLTQTHGHVSVWEPTMLSDLLSEIGFVEVTRRAFQEGAEPELNIDLAERIYGSFYVEAQKPKQQIEA